MSDWGTYSRHKKKERLASMTLTESIRGFFVIPCLLFWMLTMAAATADDWPQWRGPNRDAKSCETGLLKQWPVEGPKLLWKAVGLGEGYSGPAIVGNVLYTMGSIDGKEYVLAIETDVGEPVWRTAIGPVEYNDYSPGTRCTPTFDGDRLYALGASGNLACLRVDGGSIVWAKNFPKEFDAPGLKWGYSESVLIDGERLICTPGGPGSTLAALDKRTGRTVWKSPVGDRACYASVVRTTIGGVPQYVQFTGDAVVGVRASDGKPLWRCEAPAHTKYGGINVATPISFEDTVFAAANYGVGGGQARIVKTSQGFTAEEVYFTKNMKNHHGGLILLDGAPYGCDDPGLLTCLDYKTGKLLWRSRKPGKCSLLYADGNLYCRDEKGSISLVEATPEEFRLHGQFQQPHRSDQRAWPHPVIAHGRLYLRDQDTLLCYDVRRSDSSPVLASGLSPASERASR